MIASGVAPAATLYHWDLPQANQDAYKARRQGRQRGGGRVWQRLCCAHHGTAAAAKRRCSATMRLSLEQRAALQRGRAHSRRDRPCPSLLNCTCPTQGFLSRQVIEDYTYFAETCFKLFGDRVKKWITCAAPVGQARGTRCALGC